VSPRFDLIETMEEEKLKKSFWAFIPSMALEDKSLSSTEKLILAEIFALADENGICFPSNRHFSELLGISEVQASRCVNNLKRKGWIDVEIIPEKGNQRVIRINLGGIDEKLKRSYQKVKEGYYKKRQERKSYIETQLEKGLHLEFYPTLEEIEKKNKH
jgi:DNA-binding MarR family transcriptional regulator